jgi:putative phosphoribosyl transferase
MFDNREDAGFRLAKQLKGREFHDPLILAIPRGGIVVGAILAQELSAELDVVLARKLRAPADPECAIGAIAENGAVALDPEADDMLSSSETYFREERRHQLAEIERRKKLFRAIRPPASVEGRTVIVTDDGIATGSTMIATLKMVRAHQPRELIVAVPVGSPSGLASVRHWCDRLFCVERPGHFWSVGQFYRDFAEVDEEQVCHLLRSCLPASLP